MDRNSNRAGTWEAGDDTGAVEGCGFLSLLLYRIQNHQPMDGTTHSALGPPALITK